MIKSSIEKLASEIGFDIAMSDDKVQSDLLNGFCKGLANSMDSNKLATQLCYIVDKLDDKSCKTILEIAEFIKLKNQ